MDRFPEPRRRGIVSKVSLGITVMLSATLTWLGMASNIVNTLRAPITIAQFVYARSGYLPSIDYVRVSNTRSLRGESVEAFVRQIDTTEDWYNSAASPALLSLIPSNEQQYRNVYGRYPSSNAEYKLKQFNKDIAEDPSVIKTPSTDQVFTAIKEGGGRPTVIIAHSDNDGKRIIFPDGSKMDVSKIHSRCVRMSRRCLVLTCYGDDFELQESISAMDALSIWKHISKVDVGTVDDLVAEAVSTRARQKTRKRIAVSAVVTTATGVTVIVISTESDG